MLRRIIFIFILSLLVIITLSVPASFAESTVKTLQFNVEGMKPLSSTQLEGTLKKLKGVINATADWKPGSVTVAYDPSKVDAVDIEDAILEMNFLVWGATPL